MIDQANYTKNPILSQAKQAKKQIYKIIKHPETKKLFLRPNGNIIINYVEQGEFVIFKKSKLYVNSQNFISIPKDFPQTDQTIYEGGIDGFHFLPFGQGQFRNSNDQFDGYFKDGFASEYCTIQTEQLNSKIQCHYSWGQKHGTYKEQNDKYEIQGFYENNLKQGLFIQKQKMSEKKNIVEEEQKYYKNGIKIIQEDFNIKDNQRKLSQTTRYLIYHQDYSISNYSFKGFSYGEWLNQLGVDYYLQLVVDYYKVSFGQSIQLFNTIECQDIFSSLITSKESKVVILPKLINISAHLSEINKLIFIMNVNRGHFLILVYQNEQLYILNSMNDQLDRNILGQVAKLFPKLNKDPKSKEKMKVVNVTQQTNLFDCGIHAIYNTILQYKNFNKNVDEIDYQVTKKMMEKFRIHIKNVLINDFAHIIPQFFDSKQNHRY